jgi:hypothetical protein
MSELLCFECGANSELHMHHVVPKSAGGTKTIPLCVVCHGKVHGRDFMHHKALTIAGLKKAKDRGVKLGNPTLALVRNKDTAAAKTAWSSTTKEHQNVFRNVCLELIAEHGDITTRQLADHLNHLGYKTITGKQWRSPQVWRIMKT